MLQVTVVNNFISTPGQTGLASPRGPALNPPSTAMFFLNSHSFGRKGDPRVSSAEARVLAWVNLVKSADPKLIKS